MTATTSADDGVTVTAASRLHFGLLSWGGPERQFGGVGAMIREPAVRLRVRRADHFSASGPHADRLEQFARDWQSERRTATTPRLGAADLPAVHCHLDAAPPQHVGLGLGTQLGLAVGAALCRLAGEALPTPADLARQVRRGLRSAVGTHGFYHGGLIVEVGKQADEWLGLLAGRYDIPSPWRFVLIRPVGEAGEAGEAERQAFAQLQPVSTQRTQQLLGILHQRLLPALRAADCPAFGEAVFDYGRLAGECFAPCQGGPFNGPRLTSLVEQVRDWGVAGVGQSSWGPTLFAVVSDTDAAEDLVRRLRGLADESQLVLNVSPAANAGASIELEGHGSSSAGH